MAVYLFQNKILIQECVGESGRKVTLLCLGHLSLKYIQMILVCICVYVRDLYGMCYISTDTHTHFVIRFM